MARCTVNKSLPHHECKQCLLVCLKAVCKWHRCIVLLAKEQKLDLSVAIGDSGVVRAILDDIAVGLRLHLSIMLLSRCSVIDTFSIQETRYVGVANGFNRRAVFRLLQTTLAVSPNVEEVRDVLLHQLITMVLMSHDDINFSLSLVLECLTRHAGIILVESERCKKGNLARDLPLRFIGYRGYSNKIK